MKDSDMILFTEEEFDRILDSLPKSPLELAVFSHVMLTEDRLSPKMEQIYSIILKTSRHILRKMPRAVKEAFPEMFQ